MDRGGQRLAAALIFAVLSSDDTNLAREHPQPRRAPASLSGAQPVTAAGSVASQSRKPLVDLRVVQQREVVGAADVHAVLGLERDAPVARPRPRRSARARGRRRSGGRRGWRGLRVIVAATKQCVAPSSSGTSVRAAARRACGSRSRQSSSTSEPWRRSRMPALRRRRNEPNGRTSGSACEAGARHVNGLRERRAHVWRAERHDVADEPGPARRARRRRSDRRCGTPGRPSSGRSARSARPRRARPRRAPRAARTASARSPRCGAPCCSGARSGCSRGRATAVTRRCRRRSRRRGARRTPSPSGRARRRRARGVACGNACARAAGSSGTT